MEKIHQLKTCFCIVFSSSIFMKYFNQYFCLRQLGDSLTLWFSMATAIGIQEEQVFVMLCIAGCLVLLGPIRWVPVECSCHMRIKNAPTYFKMCPRATTTLLSFPIKNILVMFLTRVDGFSKYFPCCMVNDSLEKF